MLLGRRVDVPVRVAPGACVAVTAGVGVLANGEFAAFFQLCEVTVLPSTNPTESYGMVQVESMACGAPVLASDRPGVRVPVQITGMGKLVRPGDANDLARALVEVLDNPAGYRGAPQSLLLASTSQAVAAEYEKLFSSQRHGSLQKEPNGPVSGDSPAASPELSRSAETEAE